MRLDLTAWISFRVLPHQDTGVSSADLFGVDLLEPLERVDGNNDISSTSVRVTVQMAVLKIEKNGGLLQKTKRDKK
jgi:hypothetical protein